MTEELTVDALLAGECLDFSNVPFEKGLKLLEELVARVEAGALPLDQAIGAYEKGVHLIAHLQDQLSGAEEKLKVLRRKTEGRGKKAGALDMEEVDDI